MKNSINKHTNKIVYTLTNGKDSVELRFDYEKETIWATLNTLGELFGTDKSGISRHIDNIHATGELERDSTVAKIATVQQEGDRSVKRNLEYYNLDVIIAVGYRVNSLVATRFRQWATERLREYIIKGFTMDDERLKKHGGRYFDELIERIRDIRSSERNLYQKVTDIYATSIDYEPGSETSHQFFATVQDKMHYAVSGKTAAEIIAQRADSQSTNMGLTSFKGNYIIQADAYVAKNYLAENELKKLNLLVEAYLAFAELQAMRRVPVHMHEWVIKLDEYLKFSDQDVLKNAGMISHKEAMDKATREYVQYNEQRIKAMESDFDREVKKIVQQSTKKKGKKGL